MSVLVTPATAHEPTVLGNKKHWRGTITLDASYTSGTGIVIPATSFGLTIVEFVDVGLATNLTDTAVFVSGGRNVTLKVVIGSGWSERGSGTGSGDVFQVMVSGV